MSIPPLVCSTPPPPDICEDDPVEYDVRFNLSQDDDFEFGSYPPYNNMHCPVDNIDSKELSKAVSDHLNNLPNIPDDIYEEPTKTAEEIEDLGEENLDLNLKDNLSDTCIMPPVEIKDSYFEPETIEKTAASCSESILSHNNIKLDEDQSSLNFDMDLSETAKENDFELEKKENEDNISLHSNVENSSTIQNKNEENTEKRDPETNDSFQDNTNNDDNDFDDFNFVLPSTKSIEPIVDENPWDSNIPNDEKESIVPFEADFSSFSPASLEKPHLTKLDQNMGNEDLDDDFGDFSDFKSNNDHCEQTKDTPSDVNWFQNQTRESQIMIVEKVVNAIFEEESSEETTTSTLGKLDTCLCETWGHLRDVDVRQPYIINWNQSLGQKTLLKAVGIDSRNILFAPKWGHNTPKFASNLSVAPLQPVKNISNTISSPGDSVTSDSSTRKGSENWVDPFATDGKDSCNQDETIPPDSQKYPSSLPLEVFSSAPIIQPMRQINLPDTHIFTPTDSAEPHSTKIHYPTDTKAMGPLQPTSSHQPQGEDDDYSDFQDFAMAQPKPSFPPSINENKVVSKDLLETTAHTGILQPLKLEPIIPTVNWPDPGEIKEVFESYSDFVSNTSNQSNDSHVSMNNTASETPSRIENSFPSHIMLPSIPNHQDNIDDNFADFQSALPTATIPEPDLIKKVVNSTASNSTFGSLSDPSMFDIFGASTNVETNETVVNNKQIHFDSQSLKQTSIQSPKEQFNSLNSLSFDIPSMPRSQSMTQEVMLPTAAETITPIKPNSGQILQPLSLEGYSQINWPDPGSMDMQDLSRFNPVENLPSLKNEPSSGGTSKNSSPAHALKNKIADDELWGDFVSSKPKTPRPQTIPQPTTLDDDEWTDFVSSPNVQPANGLHTISFNVHSNLNIKKNMNQTQKHSQGLSQAALAMPTLNYVTPKNQRQAFNERQFQNL